MAFAIMGGLLVATVLTLIFLPALYVTWFRVSEPVANAVPEAVAIVEHLLSRLVPTTSAP